MADRRPIVVTGSNRFGELPNEDNLRATSIVMDDDGSISIGPFTQARATDSYWEYEELLLGNGPADVVLRLGAYDDGTLDGFSSKLAASVEDSSYIRLFEINGANGRMTWEGSLRLDGPADPAAPTDGEMWLDVVSGELKGRQNGTNYPLCQVGFTPIGSASVSGTVNNADLTGARWIRYSVTSGDATITGIAGGVLGGEILVQNASASTANLILSMNDTGSSATNRISLAGAADPTITLEPGQMRRLAYDGALWVINPTTGASAPCDPCADYTPPAYTAVNFLLCSEVV